MVDEGGQSMSLAELALIRNQQSYDDDNQAPRIDLLKTAEVRGREDSASKSSADRFQQQRSSMER